MLELHLKRNPNKIESYATLTAGISANGLAPDIALDYIDGFWITIAVTNNSSLVNDWGLCHVLPSHRLI